MKRFALASALSVAALGLASATLAQAPQSPAPVTKPLPVGTCINMGNTLEPMT